MFLHKDFLDPKINVFGRCSVCRELVSLKYENNQWVLAKDKCSHCGAILDSDEVLRSAYNNFVITQAISSANNFWASDYALIVFAAQMIIRSFIALPFSLFVFTSFVGVAFLFGVVQWFFKHGRWDTNDEEYLDAKKKMRWSFLLWSSANVLNLILFLTIKTPVW
jgi:hypothetical protein